jgi:molecular chaperone HtpG
MEKVEQAEGEKHKFDAEIGQLMNLIVNAFYSNTDVFLREVVSNASDALDKMRHQSLTDGEGALGEEKRFQIELIPDKDSRTLTIRDTGIGMTKDELIQNLGTVARSGTKAFIESLSENKSDINLIGQFGVGFYSVFLVGDRVEVRTKSNNDGCYRWESDARGEFIVTSIDYPELKRGTEIVIHLKEGDEFNKYLEESTLKNIVETHSNYINYPINLWVSKSEDTEVTDDEGDEVEDGEDDEEDDGKPKIEEVGEDEEESKEPKKKTKTVTEEWEEFEQINSNKPIWTKNPSEVTDEEYQDFYKSFSGDNQDYMLKQHFKVEGGLEFTAMMFVPGMAPFDMFESKKKSGGTKLYVRRVFITDKCEELMPEYLSFVKGIVDSNDLPLNVSREMLQQTRIMNQMRKQIVKKLIETFTTCAEEDSESYKQFWQEYSKNIKLGVHEDDQNRDKLVKLLRFFSTKHKDTEISLDQYVSEMPEGQKDIYFITGESIMSVENSPFIEALVEKGYDVLFLTDPIDEYAAQRISNFEDHKMVDVTKEGLDLDDNKEEEDETNKEYEDLCKHMKEVLGASVEKVVVSHRMTTSPCALSTGQFGWSANMERLMKAQALGKNNQMMSFMSGRRTMEINPKNRLVQLLKGRFDKDKDDKAVKDMTYLFFETATLSSGFSLEKPVDYSNRIYRMLELGLSGFDELDEAVEPAEPIEPTEPTEEEVKDMKIDGLDDLPPLGNSMDGESVMEQVD